MPVFSNTFRLRVTVVSAAVGIALIGALAMFFRRRRKKASLYHDIYIESSRGNSDVVDYGRISSNGSERVRHRSVKMNASNGDITSVSYTSSPNTTIRRSASTSSVKSDADSASTVIYSGVTRNTSLSPPQLLEVGVEFINRARSRWELALQQIDDTRSSEQDGYSAELREHLSQLLDLVNRVYAHAECRSGGRGFFNQVCTSAALDAALDEMDREYEQQRRRTYSFDEASSSDMESFVSALDMADFTDLEEQKESFQHLALYEAALIELGHGSVPCRILRTKNVKCASDTEFFAKLHCIRLAFTELFAEPENSDFFISVGRDLISSLLLHAQRDADEFLCAYDSLIAYVRNRDNSSEMEEELRSRGVKMMTFYDVVIDFLLFDAFDDLENPPASLIAVLQNRWLTTGFKETALATAVWSVLKAKRRMLKFPKGFIAHFYAVSESVSPTLAWGFLGPDGALKDMCNFFKSQVLEFMWDIFSFSRVRYTSVELLASDIMQLARERASVATAHMSAVHS